MQDGLKKGNFEVSCTWRELVAKRPGVLSHKSVLSKTGHSLSKAESCNCSAQLQASGPKMPKKSQKGRPGPVGPECQKSAEKVEKVTKKCQRETFS